MKEDLRTLARDLNTLAREVAELRGKYQDVETRVIDQLELRILPPKQSRSNLASYRTNSCAWAGKELRHRPCSPKNPPTMRLNSSARSKYTECPACGTFTKRACGI